MELVLLIVLASVCLLQIGRSIIDWRHREKSRAALLDLRCQDLIREFQRRQP